MYCTFVLFVNQHFPGLPASGTHCIAGFMDTKGKETTKGIQFVVTDLQSKSYQECKRNSKRISGKRSSCPTEIFKSLLAGSFEKPVFEHVS
jgi:hypothetical protein